MYPVGLLFRGALHTATEASLLVAGCGAAIGLLWYPVLVLPLLFTTGTALFDTRGGIHDRCPPRWAFADAVRKLYLHLTVTGLSVAVVLLTGTNELVGVLHRQLH